MQAAAISTVGYRLVAALGRTWTWRAEGSGHYDEVIRIAAGTSESDTSRKRIAELRSLVAPDA